MVSSLNCILPVHSGVWRISQGSRQNEGFKYLVLGRYIHIAYNQTPITCLSEHKNSWPKDGILRVEITTDPAVDYDVQKSYAKEERLRQKAESEGNNDLLTMMLTADT